MFCPRCGTRNPDGSRNCTLCGEGLQQGVAAVDPGRLAGHTPERQGLHAGLPPVYGGFWRRFFAFLLDSLVLFFPLATLRVLYGLDMTGEWRPESTAWWIISCLEVVVSWLYGVLLISGPARGTLGQQVMALQVTRLHGERVSFGLATWRYLAQFLTLLTLGFGYLMQVFTPRRQALHDLVSATVVVRTRRDSAPAGRPVLGITP